MAALRYSLILFLLFSTFNGYGHEARLEFRNDSLGTVDEPSPFMRYRIAYEDEKVECRAASVYRHADEEWDGTMSCYVALPAGSLYLGHFRAKSGLGLLFGAPLFQSADPFSFSTVRVQGEPYRTVWSGTTAGSFQGGALQLGKDTVSFGAFYSLRRRYTSDDEYDAGRENASPGTIDSHWFSDGRNPALLHLYDTGMMVYMERSGFFAQLNYIASWIEGKDSALLKWSWEDSILYSGGISSWNGIAMALGYRERNFSSSMECAASRQVYEGEVPFRNPRDGIAFTGDLSMTGEESRLSMTLLHADDAFYSPLSSKYRNYGDEISAQMTVPLMGKLGAGGGVESRWNGHGEGHHPGASRHLQRLSMRYKKRGSHELSLRYSHVQKYEEDTFESHDGRVQWKVASGNLKGAFTTGAQLHTSSVAGYGAASAEFSKDSISSTVAAGYAYTSDKGVYLSMPNLPGTQSPGRFYYRNTCLALWMVSFRERSARMSFGCTVTRDDQKTNVEIEGASSIEF